MTLPLFTNIPIDETINIFLGTIIPWLFLQIIQRFSEFYDQIEGVAVGLPLANIFLSFHKHKWLDNCPSEFKPTVLIIDILSIIPLFIQIKRSYYPFSRVS